MLLLQLPGWPGRVLMPCASQPGLSCLFLLHYMFPMAPPTKSRNSRPHPYQYTVFCHPSLLLTLEKRIFLILSDLITLPCNMCNGILHLPPASQLPRQVQPGAIAPADPSAAAAPPPAPR